MECNKEEALRAMEIAEEKMRARDFSGAQKMSRKAQQLFPLLPNVDSMLTVCEVHCSAENKIPGTKENDFYQILQIGRTADENAIKKQFKKLALVVHPDKNKFPGAGDAFHFIKEASKVLSDKAKRSLYDSKYKRVKNDAPKSQAQPSLRKTNVDVRTNEKEGVRMHKPNVAKGNEGVGTSKSSEKKRKRKPESESTAKRRW